MGQVQRLEGVKGKHLGVVIQDRRRHQKYRCQKTKAAWEAVRRLSKLPASGKRKVATQQLLPILTYGCELHHEPSEQQKRLAYDIYRWIIGAYPGSRKDKAQCFTVLFDEGVMRTKRVRWVTCKEDIIASRLHYFSHTPAKLTTGKDYNLLCYNKDYVKVASATSTGGFL